MEDTIKNSILIVDDDDFNLNVLSEILKSDYIIYNATSGRQAIEMAASVSPDLILLDIIMPEIDGFEVISMLKKSETVKDIPVIFITGLSNEADAEKGIELGAADYITKPFKKAVVKARIDTQIKLLEYKRIIENFGRHVS